MIGLFGFASFAFEYLSARRSKKTSRSDCSKR
jgi:hypothetical protein